MGYITEYIINFKNRNDVSIAEFINKFTELENFDREDNNKILYSGSSFFIELKKIYNTNTKKTSLILKTYLQEDKSLDEDESLENWDKYSDIIEIDFENNQEYEKKFKIFKKLQGVIQNLDRKAMKDYIEKVECIRDDYSFILLKKSYPIIYEIENLMRTLIAKIMYFRAGSDWYKNEMPSSIKIPDDRREEHILGSDFSHLSSMLFDKIVKDGHNELYQAIENEKDYSILKNLIPKSNWDNYFANLEMGIEHTDFKKLLVDLSQDRNTVAHNKIQVKYDFYDKLDENFKKFRIIIENAIFALEQEIEKTLKEHTIKTLKDNKNIPYKDFFEEFENLVNILKDYYEDFVKDRDGENDNFIYNLKNKISKIEPLNDDECLKKIYLFNNYMIDLISENFSQKPTKKNIIDKIQEIKDVIEKIEECPKFKYKEDILDDIQFEDEIQTK